MIAQTQFAITGEDTRYFLNGALFVLQPDSMTLVATDGHRLALVTVPRDSERPTREETTRHPAEEDASRSSRGCWPRATATSSYERGENHLFFDVGGRAADLADDRRAVPGLRARHPEGQRQAHRVRSRSADERASSAWRCCRTSARAR